MKYLTFSPGPFGPYSNAVDTGDFLFVAGQIPVNEKGEVVEENIYKQAKAALNNLIRVVERSNYDKENIVSLRVYTTDLENASLINKAFEELLGEPFPARELVGVASLPKDALLEIAGIAKK